MRIYQAGPLFTTAEIEYNYKLASILRRGGHEVFLPQEHEQDMSPGYPPKIFLSDVAGLDWAEVVVAVLDGSDVDSGTAWECGYAFARDKTVFGLRSDFRILGREEKCNMMIQECCLGPICADIRALVKALSLYIS